MTTKAILIGLGLATAGFCGGFVAGVKVAKKRLNNDIQKEEPHEEVWKEPEVEERIVIPKGFVKAMHSYSVDLEETDEDEGSYDLVPDDIPDIPPAEDRFPVIVSEEDIEEGGLYCESTVDELTYYRGDNQLVDCSYEVIGDIGDVVGKDVADMLPTTSMDQIFVHNFRMDANFIITFSNETSPAGCMDFDSVLDDDPYDI